MAAARGAIALGLGPRSPACYGRRALAYLVLARKYRPQRFTDMVGQDHVARTLRHAIEQERVHHAYLFSGARGLGKTTTARILARAPENR